MKRIAGVCLGLALGAAAWTQNWPSFRGRNASGIADGQNPPAAWDATKSINILWKTPIPGLAHSSPVVWGDRVFVTTAISVDPNFEFRPELRDGHAPAQDTAPHAWRVYCLDKNTGAILWEKTARAGVPKSKRHPKSSQANSTPATDGKHVVALFGSEGLYAFDYDGELVWKRDLGVLSTIISFDPDYEGGFGSSPIIYRDLVIVQCDIEKGSFLAAYDIQDGKLVWRTARDERLSYSTPTVYEGKTRAELITRARHIRGYDPLSGKELWRLSGNAEETVATPVVGQGLIFIVDSFPQQPFYAIRLGAAGDISLNDGMVSNEYVAWSKKRGAWHLPTPLVYGDLLYTLSNNGILSCYNPTTGERIYHERVGGKGGGYTASPVAADGKIYFTSEDGDIYVVKAGPKYELLASNPMGEVCMATPAISDGMILVRTQHHVYGIGERRAKQKNPLLVNKVP